MKVCVGRLGRFHAFDLAQQLERLGFLERLYTGYPRSEVEALPPGNVETYPWFYSSAILVGRLGFQSVQNYLTRFAIESFDRWMAKNLQPCFGETGLYRFFQPVNRYRIFKNTK